MVYKTTQKMPAFRLNGTLVYFAAFINHIGFFPTSSAIEALQCRLSGGHMRRFLKSLLIIVGATVVAIAATVFIRPA